MAMGGLKGESQKYLATPGPRVLQHSTILSRRKRRDNLLPFVQVEILLIWGLLGVPLPSRETKRWSLEVNPLIVARGDVHVGADGLG